MLLVATGAALIILCVNECVTKGVNGFEEDTGKQQHESFTASSFHLSMSDTSITDHVLSPHARQQASSDLRRACFSLPHCWDIRCFFGGSRSESSLPDIRVSSRWAEDCSSAPHLLTTRIANVMYHKHQFSCGKGVNAIIALYFRSS